MAVEGAEMMTREQILDGLSRLMRASPEPEAPTVALGILGLVTPQDMERCIEDGRFVVMSRGMLAEIIRELKE